MVRWGSWGQTVGPFYMGGVAEMATLGLKVVILCWRCRKNSNLGSWAHLGVILGSSWDHLGVILGHLGSNLGPSWAILAPSWAILGHLGAILGHLGAI